eukprot:CAMPEP_0181299708 /NCGR_PEP_ID=MMETSP1101-20121128/6494_1 /TAXON_ID=46948 /ORGANISM="Rhodomonas abbreviata, Strain Caron Lab Isolate" /LENGTH=292 /DNA_ID=CAMNT_0023404883 /DNA_START=222 /DNA_END=1096 /DNA_ORIENTATION=+
MTKRKENAKEAKPAATEKEAVGTVEPPQSSEPVPYAMIALSLVAIIWICGCSLHLLAPEDFCGAGMFCLRSSPVYSMSVLTELMSKNSTMAERSTLYTEICQDNLGPLGFARNIDAPRHPLPPFTQATALEKVKAAEAAWNKRDPALVAGAYSSDSVWRNRGDLFIGRKSIEEFLTRKWAKETNYKLVKNLWTWHDNRIAVRFTYEYQSVETGQWYRCHGNELWQFDSKGYMQHRDMSGNDIAIDESQRLFKSSEEPAVVDEAAEAAAAFSADTEEEPVVEEATPEEEHEGG